MLLAPLPDDARLWVFTADRPLGADLQAALLAAVRTALTDWASHGRPVSGAADLLHGRVLVVGATLRGAISGCGIDHMVHAVESAARDLGVSWVVGLDVAYEATSGALETAARPAFRALARDGAVTAATRLVDATLPTVGALRAAGDVLRPAGETWARAFLPAPVAA